jgi:pilus assembly protein Flp/PilA
MIEYLKTWLALPSDTRAVTALEYGLIAALVAAVIATAVGTLGNDLVNTFNNVANAL